MTRAGVLPAPTWLGFLVARDGVLCRRVLGTYLATVFDFYRERAADVWLPRDDDEGPRLG